jgi:hypothetical protein
MRKLLNKELRLCLNPQVLIMASLSILVVVPSWPSLIGMIYVLSGLATIFPRSLADKDMEYTAMLPIRKGDVVKAKMSLIVAIEVFAVLVSIPFALLKDYLLTPAMVQAELALAEPDLSSIAYDWASCPTLGSYGLLLVGFALYNLILFPWYYKNPQKVNWPQTVALLASVVFIGAASGLQIVIPSLYNTLQDPTDVTSWIVQGAVAAIGIVSFAGLSVLAERLSEKNFAKVDL